MTQPQTDEWRIQKRGRACSLCAREFRSEEEHYSGIAELQGRFERRDVCLPCWDRKPACAAEAPAASPPSPWPQATASARPRRSAGGAEAGAGQRPELFSYWKTRMPRREERRLEDVNAMLDFFKKLTEKPSDDPARQKITYLTALLLARKRRLKLAGSSGGRLKVEKAWDGETIEIADPPISEAELADLRLQMERLFEIELSADFGR